MTRDEAVEAAKELGAHHADRATHRWIPRQKKDHTWEVVKVAMPPGARIDPLKTTTEAVPEAATGRRPTQRLRPEHRPRSGLTDRRADPRPAGSFIPLCAAGSPDSPLP